MYRHDLILEQFFKYSMPLLNTKRYSVLSWMGPGHFPGEPELFKPWDLGITAMIPIIFYFFDNTFLRKES
jgi:hypothetical protein